jgi:hypothetical protein
MEGAAPERHEAAQEPHSGMSGPAAGAGTFLLDICAFQGYFASFTVVVSQGTVSVQTGVYPVNAAAVRTSASESTSAPAFWRPDIPAAWRFRRRRNRSDPGAAAKGRSP